MRPALLFSRIGLVYSFCMLAVSLYFSYSWNEQGIDLAHERLWCTHTGLA